MEKRPLHRPAIPSPYAGAQQEKVVYVSARTPFISAVKRVEKLLHLAEKRAVQAATTVTKQKSRGASGKRAGARDEIVDIAEEVARRKAEKRTSGLNEGDGNDAREEVVIKGTGKAIQKVLQMALWFQQREEQYTMTLSTGSVMAIDDVSVDEDVARRDPETRVENDLEGEVKVADSVDEERLHDIGLSGFADAVPSILENPERTPMERRTSVKQEDYAVSGSRIRWLSVLEVAVSLR